MSRLLVFLLVPISVLACIPLLGLGILALTIAPTEVTTAALIVLALVVVWFIVTRLMKRTTSQAPEAVFAPRINRKGGYL